MFRLMIVYNNDKGTTSQVVDFTTEGEAEKIRIKLNQQRYLTVYALY